MSINIRKAYKEYNGRRVLEIEELTFEKGFVYVLMGLNGSGKSTLLQCASGLESFTDGEVFYNGYESIEQNRKNISVMTQKPYMFSGTVLDNIKLGLEFREYTKETIQDKVLEYLNFFQMDHLLRNSAKKLSGGEQAKVALLRTAILETNISFLDEPTASMDIESTLKAEDLIRKMASNQRTVILVTHDLYQAERTADYVIFLDKGRIIEKGEKSRVFNAPQHKLVRKILRRGEEND
jgi:tungstate transport system ATP-binding protein